MYSSRICRHGIAATKRLRWWTLPVILAAAPIPTRAGGDASIASVPQPGYPALRYVSLWTSSPFSVESFSATAMPDSDLKLVGVAEVDGVAYASFTLRATGVHFLLAGGKTSHGVSLIAINQPVRATAASAIIRKNEVISEIPLESGPNTVPTAPLSSLPDLSSVPPGGAGDMRIEQILARPVPRPLGK